jgi:hypothetical protein
MLARLGIVIVTIAVVLGLLFVPRAALAQATNCPTEPASNVPIGDGETYIGSNCNLYAVGDVDSFIFSGTNGDTYQLTAAVNGGSNDICMTVYNGAVEIYYGCTTYSGGGTFAVAPVLTLTATGTITIDITEQAPSATQNYALSMERIYPSAPNAAAVPKLGESLPGSLPYLTDLNEWTFKVATTGTYEVTAALPSGATPGVNLCMNVYQPGGASAGSGCTTWSGGGDFTVLVDFTPTTDGTSMAFVSVDGNDTALSSYDFEVSCLLGTCPPLKAPAKKAECADDLSYSTGTLTMNVVLGTPVAATWNGWLTTGNTIQQLWSTSEPKTEPPVEITQTASVSASGEVGVLSTLTTATEGIICSSWQTINTGTP